MTKQKADTLPIMRPPTRLRKRGTNINRLQLLARLLLLRMRHRIRNDHPTQPASIERRDRIAAENPVRHDRHHLPRPVLHHRVRGLDEGPARVRHVVH